MNPFRLHSGRVQLFLNRVRLIADDLNDLRGLKPILSPETLWKVILSIMSKLRQNVRKKRSESSTISPTLFKNEDGAIDLASIMVGIIVIGLIGGVIAATVFAVIPWTQDNAAKQQLDSIAAAQSAYMGLSSSGSQPAGLSLNSYASSADLKTANLLSKGDNYCTIKTGEGKEYEAYAQSSSGKTWKITNTATKPLLTDAAEVPSSCGQILPYTDKTPKLTTLTYKCDTTKKGVIPMNGSLTGVETWTGGSEPVVGHYTNRTTATPRTLLAGVEYKVTFDGTYKSMDSSIVPADSVSIADCLRSVDHWGQETGVTEAVHGFRGASNLTSVPAHIPTTITNYYMMFAQAYNFNDPDVGQWDTSNVVMMNSMFSEAYNFNQPLDNWDTSKVDNMGGMFLQARKFNQPLNMWDTSNVTVAESMFNNAHSFNQPLNDWDTSQVTNMAWMFNSAVSFNQDLDKWDVSKVIIMQRVFCEAWSFNGNISTWDTSNVADMSLMFGNNEVFNSDISKWNVSKVTDMTQMLNRATSFTHNLSGWNTASLSKATQFAPASFPNAYMPARTTK